MIRKYKNKNIEKIKVLALALLYLNMDEGDDDDKFNNQNENDQEIKFCFFDNEGYGIRNGNESCFKTCIIKEKDKETVIDTTIKEEEEIYNLCYKDNGKIYHLQSTADGKICLADEKRLFLGKEVNNEEEKKNIIVNKILNSQTLFELDKFALDLSLKSSTSQKKIVYYWKILSRIDKKTLEKMSKDVLNRIYLNTTEGEKIKYLTNNGEHVLCTIKGENDQYIYINLYTKFDGEKLSFATRKVEENTGSTLEINIIEIKDQNEDKQEQEINTNNLLKHSEFMEIISNPKQIINLEEIGDHNHHHKIPSKGSICAKCCESCKKYC